MKILHIITTIERGGAENQLVILCKEQIRMGGTVEVYHLKGNPELRLELETVGASVKKLSGFPILQVFKLNQAIRKSDFDIIHAHLPRAELIASLANIRLPLIVSRHNAERFLPNGPKWLSQILSRIVLRRTSARISISNHVSKFISESGEGAKHLDFVTVHYGYEFTKTVQVTAKNEREKIELVAVGRLVPQKDYVTLLTALSFLSKRHFDFRLNVVGGGALKNQLRDLSEELQIEDKISWIGRVANVSEYMKSADIFVISSIYEGFGLVILEAMEAQIPIVCSNIATFKEILGAEYPGYFEVMNPNSLAESLSYAQSHKDDLNYAIQLRRELFDSKMMALRILSIYENVLLDKKNQLLK